MGWLTEDPLARGMPQEFLAAVQIFFLISGFSFYALLITCLQGWLSAYIIIKTCYFRHLGSQNLKIL